MTKKISKNELNKMLKVPTLSLYNSQAELWMTNYSNSMSEVKRMGTYKDYKKESIKSILKSRPSEFKQMLIDGVEFSNEELIEIIENGASSAATMLLESEIEIPDDIARLVVSQINVPYSSYIKKYIPRLMLSYNEMLDINFVMGTLLDLTLYICDVNVLNTASDRLLYWIFTDKRISESLIEKANDHVRRMYKKYKMTIKFSTGNNTETHGNTFASVYAYDIKKDVKLFNMIFGEDEDTDDEEEIE